MRLPLLAQRPLRTVLAVAAVLLSVNIAAAQLPQARLYSLFPPGGKAGSTLDVQLTSGDDLDDVSQLIFTHPGIKAVPKTQDVGGKPQPVDRAFVVTIDGSVPVGMYEVRTRGKYGLSNPRNFYVGSRDETAETEPNNTFEQVTTQPVKAEPAAAAKPAAAAIPLNTVINGQMNSATDIDLFKFQGKKGQRIIARARAARLDSRMQAALEIYDANHRRLDFGREKVRHDPLVDLTLPADGEYFVKIYDFLYRGGPEYAYRLTVGTVPHIDYIWPPAGPPGTTSTFTLFGRNLPGGQPAGVTLFGEPLQKLDVPIALPAVATLQTADPLDSFEAGIDGIPYVLQTPAGNSNPRMVYLATAPVVTEQEPNDTPEKAQKVTPPVELAAQFQAERDTDIVQFDAKAGEVWMIVAYAQRCGTTADPYMVIEQVTLSDKGEETIKRIAAVDDDATNLYQNVFDTLTDDPIYKFQAPADGTYRVTLRDRYSLSHGNPRLVYRLAIRKEQPDFRVVVLPTLVTQNRAQGSSPASLALRKGDNYSAAVMVFRRDGFDGAVEVWAEGLPPGVTCKGASIGPTQPNGELIFTAAENAAEWAGTITILSKARIEDPEKRRALAAAQAAVKPATDAVPKLAEAVAKAQDAANKANDALAKAKEAAAAKPDDKGLAQKAQQAQDAANKAAEALKKAQDELAAGQKKVADAEAAVKTAEQQLQASVREVSHPARFGTVVWNGGNNMPGTARVAQSIGLSVMKESAPFQVTTEVFKVEARQNRQILIPVKLAKRNGFDNAVNLQFIGFPQNAQIQVENKPIEKGKTEQLLRLFVNGNAPAGTYTVCLQATGQVSYSRNPEAAEAAKAEAAEVTKALTVAQEAAKKAVQDRDAATKKAAETAAAQKTAQAAKAEADKQLAAANAAVTQAQQALAAAAEDKKAEAQQKLTQAQEAAKKATEAAAAAAKALTDADAAAKAAADAKTQAETAAKQADAAAKQADAAKKAADKKAQDAANAAKPKNVNVLNPSTPIVIEVKPAPLTLAANVPGGGNLKRGEKLDVKVTVNRTNGFTGPVTLTLPLPPGVAGLSAAPVTVPADQKEGTLTIQAAGDATEGQLPYMVIQAKADFQGEALVDVPITLKVNK